MLVNCHEMFRHETQNHSVETSQQLNNINGLVIVKIIEGQTLEGATERQKRKVNKTFTQHKF